MFNFSASFDTSALERVDEHLRVMPRLLQTALKRREAPLRKLVLEQVAIQGKPVQYPIVWQTDLMRRAYHASDGFGGGIPSVSTGNLVAGWRAMFEFNADGGGFTVWNVMPYADFVVGENQQRMFQGRWINAPDVLDEYAPVIILDVEETFITVGDPFGGVK